jgi:hypothetical protein
MRRQPHQQVAGAVIDVPVVLGALDYRALVFELAQ